MAIRLDIFENPENEVVCNNTFENPYKDLIDKANVFEKHVTVIPTEFIKTHSVPITPTKP